ncbi:MAG: hypothetical protein N4A36_01260 [Candidatus Gracilibacteria bacterium]|nr:hypothetical protein [Candidatus Gracilibacteria bacterium]
MNKFDLFVFGFVVMIIAAMIVVVRRVDKEIRGQDMEKMAKLISDVEKLNKGFFCEIIECDFKKYDRSITHSFDNFGFRGFFLFV